VERALALALSLDIPFWPQLPHLNYYEDMYVQASEHFPGILLDLEKRTLRFSHERFALELEEALGRFDDPAFFDISATYSQVYPVFWNWTFPTDRPFGGNWKDPSASASTSGRGRSADPFR
jgi:hypothetical protein